MVCFSWRSIPNSRGKVNSSVQSIMERFLFKLNLHCHTSHRSFHSVSNNCKYLRRKHSSDLLSFSNARRWNPHWNQSAKYVGCLSYRLFTIAIVYKILMFAISSLFRIHTVKMAHAVYQKSHDSIPPDSTVEDYPVMIMHGLLGSKNNWKFISEKILDRTSHKVE